MGAVSEKRDGSHPQALGLYAVRGMSGVLKGSIPPS